VVKVKLGFEKKREGTLGGEKIGGDYVSQTLAKSYLLTGGDGREKPRRDDQRAALLKGKGNRNKPGSPTQPARKSNKKGDWGSKEKVRKEDGAMKGERRDKHKKGRRERRGFGGEKG